MVCERIKISNGRVVDPERGFDQPADIFITEGRIAGIGSAPAGFVADREIDAAGCVVAPGLIDLSARLSGLESELSAAVAGGVTALVCPPDTRPALDEPGLVERLVRRAEKCGLARVHPLGALTRNLDGDTLAEMAGLMQAGCIALSQANRPLGDNQILLRALQYAATFDFPVWLQPIDAALARGGVAHDGAVAARLGLTGIPVSAETVALATIVELVRETGARVHLRRLSSAAAVRLAAAARAEGLPVTCDVGAHHLHLTEDDIGFFDARARLDPPLRAASDRDALRRGVASGVIPAICSDHTPVSDDGKLLPFGEADCGASGLELLLPLTLRWGREGGLSLAQTLRPVTSAAAAIAGLTGGRLDVGAAADLCIFDPDATWTVAADTLRSQGKNTPFLGQTLTGRVRHTLVGGRPAFAD